MSTDITSNDSNSSEPQNNAEKDGLIPQRPLVPESVKPSDPKTGSTEELVTRLGDQEQALASLAKKRAVLSSLVQRHFPKLKPAVDLALAVCATLLLKDNANPTAVVFVGPPSAGKSTVLEMFGDATVNGEILCYVSDSFTPASFVSQAANVAAADLKEVDLLPRIRHKILVTPELAPTFRGNEDHLVGTFSVITRVLDGQGFSRDAGTHGQREYRGDYLFNWLGATTPFDQTVWKVMDQLGSRMFFLLVDQHKTLTAEDLMAMTSSVSYREKLAECRQAVHEFLQELFTCYGGVRGVTWDPENDPRDVRLWIARCAQLLAQVRGAPSKSNPLGSQEIPLRAHAVLLNLARGHALVQGRTQLTEEDVPLIAEVTFSTMPHPLGAVYRALAVHPQGLLTRAEVQAVLQVKSHNTARDVMEDFQISSVIRYTSQGQGKSAHLTFYEEWAWCQSPTFQAFLQPSSNLSKNRRCV